MMSLNPALIESIVGLWLLGYLIFIAADASGLTGRPYISFRKPLTALLMLFIYVFWPVLVLIGLIFRKF